MYAQTTLRGTSGQRLPNAGNQALRPATAGGMLAVGLVAIALVAAMLVAMLPGFAGVRVDSSAIPAPTPAPVPMVVAPAQ
jgi:hypothetical protein